MGSGPALSILVVDDEVLIAECFAEALRYSGFSNVRAVFDGKSALEIIQDGASGQIDVLVTDYRMPGEESL